MSLQYSSFLQKSSAADMIYALGCFQEDQLSITKISDNCIVFNVQKATTHTALVCKYKLTVYTHVFNVLGDRLRMGSHLRNACCQATICLLSTNFLSQLSGLSTTSE